MSLSRPHAIIRLSAKGVEVSRLWKSKSLSWDKITGRLVGGMTRNCYSVLWQGDERAGLVYQDYLEAWSHDGRRIPLSEVSYEGAVVV